jgi:hypothetical protein
MYSGPAGVLFVEYKYIQQLPKRDTTVLKTSLSLLQVQWLDRMAISAHAVLIIGAGNNNAIILSRDFSQKVSKLRFLKEAVSRPDVADYIYQHTHNAGRCYETPNQTAPSCRKLTKDLGQEKSRNAVYSS